MKHESKAVVTDGAFGKSFHELAELRRYRDKTEAALLSLSMTCADPNWDYPPLRGDLKELGLWREPPKDGV